MRASKKIDSKKHTVTGQKEVHISGAEGLYDQADIQKIVKKYIERALNHPKGKADKVTITIEETKQEPRGIRALPVATISCRNPSEAKNIVIRLLGSLGISGNAVHEAFELIQKETMRGAAIVAEKSGKRLDPDTAKGVRVSRLGIGKRALRSLSSQLARNGINTDTVKEALILASKVAASGDVIAELCVSDDPDYTTGYVASKKFGYVRIPHIKYNKSMNGGRALFVKEDLDVGETTDYLERMPVLVDRISICRGEVSMEEVLDMEVRL